MAGPDTFVCGHPRVPRNMITSDSSPRCRTCKNDRQRQRYLDNLGFVGPVSEEHYPASMEMCSRAFLRALYREHPYVFEAALRTGRQAVRP